MAQRYGGNRPAVALRDIATCCRIKKVVFRPLLVDGGLGRYGNGFVMYVNCQAENVEEFSARFRNDGGYDLPTRQRFTIAHEIAHTLFFDFKKSPPAARVTGAHHSELQSLEATCNVGAGRLLLPHTRLRSALKDDLPSLTAEGIVKIAAKFRVSVNALLSELEAIGLWGDISGLAAVVDTFDGPPIIKSLGTDSFSKGLFPWAKRGVDISSGICDRTLIVFGGTTSEVEYMIPCTQGTQQRVVATATHIGTTRSRFVVAIRKEGELVRTRDG